MTERMWCIVDADGDVLPWTVRNLRRDAIAAEMISVCPIDAPEAFRFTWRQWSKSQGYRTARCTFTVEE